MKELKWKDIQHGFVANPIDPSQKTPFFKLFLRNRKTDKFRCVSQDLSGELNLFELLL